MSAQAGLTPEAFLARVEDLCEHTAEKMPALHELLAEFDRLGPCAPAKLPQVGAILAALCKLHRVIHEEWLSNALRAPLEPGQPMNMDLHGLLRLHMRFEPALETDEELPAVPTNRVRLDALDLIERSNLDDGLDAIKAHLEATVDEDIPVWVEKLTSLIQSRAGTYPLEQLAQQAGLSKVPAFLAALHLDSRYVMEQEQFYGAIWVRLAL